MVSNEANAAQANAAQFVLAFVGNRGAGRDDHKVFGLGSCASREGVISSYRRRALIYHPDRTAEFLPEFRRLAEERMKEINAAYERLRRHATWLAERSSEFALTRNPGPR